MSASGEGNNESPAARTVELPEDLDGSSTAHTPALPPDIATDLQKPTTLLSRPFERSCDRVA